MTDIFNTFIVFPLMGALTTLAGTLGSYGIAIIVLTIAIKLVTFPLTYQQIKSSKSMRDVQPLMEEAKKRYGKDRERLTQETMKIYKENGVNPAMGCLPMVIQMPIWFGLYWALLNLKGESFANEPFLWVPNLAHPDQFPFILVILTIATQFVVQKMMTMPSTDPQQQTMNRVMLFMPLTFGFVATSVPSGLAIYWITTNVFTFFQQLFTTGWGTLLPEGMEGPRLPFVPVQAPRAAPRIPPAAEPAAGSSTKPVKAARQKKSAGSRSPREEKRTDGKR
ncbi:MAG TPA: YidC/Oxa1 family membrane protein insertase [Chloroflexota bacterium]